MRIKLTDYIIIAVVMLMSVPIIKLLASAVAMASVSLP